MKINTLLFTSILPLLFTSAWAEDYYFTRGVEGESATRNWSDLRNWNTGATSGDGWTTSEAAARPGSDISNRDVVTLGVNSGFNGADTDLNGINLDVDASLSKLIISESSNLPTEITSSNGSSLFLSAPLQSTTVSEQSPSVFDKNSSSSFVFNTDIEIETSAGLADGGSYSSLWTRMYFYAGTTTFSDGYTISSKTNSLSGTNGDIRFYAGNSALQSSQVVVNINSKLVSPSQIVFGGSGGTGSYTGKFVLGGSESNELTGYMIVENDVTLVLNKSNGALAVTGARFQILGGTIIFMGDNQISTSTQLSFSQASTSSTATQPLMQLNGFSQQVRNVRFEAASWLSKGASIRPVLDFGENSSAQTFTFEGFEFGGLVSRADAETSKGLIIADSAFVIKNYNIGEDHLISTVKLSDHLLSTTIEDVEGMTWMDFLVFEGYDMDLYDIVETANGSNWEYSLVAVPEPAIAAAILGALAIAFAAYRRK